MGYVESMFAMVCGLVCVGMLGVSALVLLRAVPASGVETRVTHEVCVVVLSLPPRAASERGPLETSTFVDPFTVSSGTRH